MSADDVDIGVGVSSKLSWGVARVMGGMASSSWEVLMLTAVCVVCTAASNCCWLHAHASGVLVLSFAKVVGSGNFQPLF